MTAPARRAFHTQGPSAISQVELVETSVSWMPSAAQTVGATTYRDLVCAAQRLPIACLCRAGVARRSLGRVRAPPACAISTTRAVSWMAERVPYRASAAPAFASEGRAVLRMRVRQTAGLLLRVGS